MENKGFVVSSKVQPGLAVHLPKEVVTFLDLSPGDLLTWEDIDLPRAAHAPPSIQVYRVRLKKGVQ